jgi:Domain of unknown function (DUF397)
MGMDIVNGVPAPELGAVDWRKSARSNSQGNCVELARLGGRRVGMRDSKHPTGPALVFGADEIASWIGDLKAGHYDHLLVAEA